MKRRSKNSEKRMNKKNVRKKERLITAIKKYGPYYVWVFFQIALEMI